MVEKAKNEKGTADNDDVCKSSFSGCSSRAIYGSIGGAIEGTTVG
jgi:hypothetical protein